MTANAGYHLFNTGDVLTAAQVQYNLQNQTIMYFASSAARTSALSGVLVEGMFSYLADTDSTEYYSGSAWTSISNPGDITAVTTTAPLQGGGTSGAIALTVDAASTSASGVVQLSNSTSTTSSVLAATPTAVKSAYDLADAAIAKTTVTTAGDIIYRNATVPTRLGIGTVGQVLTVNSGATAPEWSTPAGGGGMTQILAPTSIVSSPTQNTFTTSSISGSYNQLVIYIKDFKADNYFGLSVRFNSDATADAYQSAAVYSSGASAYAESYRGTYGMIFNNMYGSTDDNFAVITIPNYANTTTRKVAYGNTAYVADDTNFANQIGAVSWKNTAAISTITLYTVDSGYSSGKWTGGTIEIYGVN